MSSSDTHELPAAGRIGRLAVMFVAHAVGTANVTIVLASAPAVERSLGLSHAEFGAMLAAYYVSILLFSLPAGLIVDRFGIGLSLIASHALLGEAARKAVAMDDSDAAAHTALAIYDLFSGRHEESRRRLRRALDLDPDSVFARGYLGASYAFSGDYEAALPHLDEAIRLSPRDPLLIIWHVCKGWAALLTQRYEEAVGFATLAAEANPEFPDIYVVLAAANGQLARVDAARAALDQLSRRMPALTTNDERLSRPLERPEHRESFLEGLRKAGMPA